MIESVSDLIKFLNNGKYSRDNHAHIRYMFRGHSDESWKLVPGVYRSEFEIGKQQENEDDEDARLRVEQHLFQDFVVMSAGLRSGRETDCDLYVLQQHHGMPTRLLDWSNNALAALYFAVCDADYDDRDGAFFALDAFDLARCQNAADEECIKGVATFRRRYVKNAVSVISKWKKKERFGKWVIALRLYYNHTRIALQRSCFTFHVPARRELDPGALECIKVISVKGDCKPAMRQELAALGIDEFAIFCDMDHLARRLKATHLAPKS